MNDIFYGTSGPQDASIMIVGESWGGEEYGRKQPFVGQSGQELNKILAECGINRKDVFCTNVVSDQPTSNKMEYFFHTTKEAKEQGQRPIKDLYPRMNVLDGISDLALQIEEVKPNLIIGFGNYALWALTENNFKTNSSSLGRKIPSGIGSWRGSQLKTTPLMGFVDFLPTYHPAAAMRNWPWRYLIKHDILTRAKLVPFTKPDYDFIIRPNYTTCIHTLVKLIQILVHRKLRLSIDLETRNGHIACIGIAWGPLHAISIPFMCVDRNEGYFTTDEEIAIIRMISELLLNPNTEIVGQNFLYDIQYLLRYWNCAPKVYMDTMIAHHVLFPASHNGAMPKDLSHLSSMYCDYHVYWKDEGKEWDASIPEDQYWSYNCMDAVTCWEISHEIDKTLDALNLRPQFDFQMRQFPMVFRMMVRGILIDKEERTSTGVELFELIINLGDRLENMLPSDILPRQKGASAWYNSPVQQAIFFYDIMDVQPVLDPKTRNRTVDKDALHVIAQRQPLLIPLCTALEELRSMRVFYNTFISAKLDPDNRMRCSYNISGTDTYRHSSSKNAWGRGGNLQNLPEGREE